MGVIDLQSYSITEFENCDKKVYMIGYSSRSMNQTNESFQRLDKAWELIRVGNVRFGKNPLRATVTSLINRINGKTKDYSINIAAQDCTCADHSFRPELICKHIRAAQLERQLQIGEITLEVKN